MEKIVQFLTDLTENNNKEWFHANKPIYEESRDKILFLTEVLINEVGKFDKDIAGTNAKDCMFRIFRDVRFSKDKSPYKTNFGSFIAKGGRKSTKAGYYFHIEPGGSFVGGGVYMPPSQPLKQIRNYISEHAEEYLEIINSKSFKSALPEMYDHKLKTAPKGFPKDHKHIESIRYQSFVFSKTLKSEEVIGEDFLKLTVQSFKQLSRLNSFLNAALE